MAKGKRAKEALQAYAPQEGFFSILDELISNAPIDEVTAEQWRNYLKPGRTLDREGVKFPLQNRELEETGLNQLFQMDPSIEYNKDLLRDYIQQSRPLYEQEISQEFRDRAQYAHGRPDIYRSSDEYDYEENQTLLDGLDWPYGHFRDNTLQWSRSTGHDLPDDKLALLVEEIQSDTSRALRKKKDRSTVLQSATPEEAEELTRVAQQIEQLEADYRVKSPAERDQVRVAYSEARNPLLDQRDRILKQIQERDGPFVGARTSQDDLDLKEYDASYPGSNPILTPAESARRASLKKKIPRGLPMSDPKDYSLFELKKQLMDAVDHEYDYLALVTGQDQIDRYGFPPESQRAKGSREIYDQVHRGNLERLAKQYGVPFEELEIPGIGDGGSGHGGLLTENFQNFGVEDTADLFDSFLEMSMDSWAVDSDPSDLDWPSDYIFDIQAEMRRKLEDKPEYRSSLNIINNTIHDMQMVEEQVKEILEKHHIPREVGLDNERRKVTQRELNEEIRPHELRLNVLAQRAHDEISKIIAQYNPSAPTSKRFPAIKLSPEDRERIRKAGVGMAKGGKIKQAADPAAEALRAYAPREGFFSVLDELIANAPIDEVTAEQWRNYLQPGRALDREGVKFPLQKRELEDTKLSELFEMDPSIEYNKDLLRDYIQQSRPVYDSTIDDTYNPNQEGMGFDTLWLHTPDSDYQSELTQLPEVKDSLSSHFGAPGRSTVSWGRSSLHDDPELKQRVYLAEEIQSDVNQRAAEKLKIGSTRMLTQATPDEVGDYLALQLRLKNLYNRGRIRHSSGESGVPKRRTTLDDAINALSYADKQELTRVQNQISDFEKSIYQRAGGEKARLGYAGKDQEKLKRILQREGWVRELSPEIGEIIYELQHLPSGDVPIGMRDSKDFSLFELKKMLLDAADNEADYLAMIRGSDQAQRNQFNPGDPEYKGMLYAYDEMLPSLLKKLGQQYGAEFEEIPLSVGSMQQRARPQMLRAWDVEGPAELQQFTEDRITKAFQGGDPEDIIGRGELDHIQGEFSDLFEDLHDVLEGDDYSDRELEKFQQILGDYESAKNEYEARWSEYMNEDTTSSLNDEYNNDNSFDELRDQMEKSIRAMSVITSRLSERYAEAARRHDPAREFGSGKPFPAIKLTPEVRERIKKAGVGMAKGGKVKESLSKSNPLPMSKDAYDNYKRFIEPVDVDELLAMRGNELGKTDLEKLKEEILASGGLKEPVMIQVGKKDRRAVVGEGNHRVQAAKELGYTHVPTRVAVQNRIWLDEMDPPVRDDLIPNPDEYFSADAKPSDVFTKLKILIDVLDGEDEYAKGGKVKEGTEQLGGLIGRMREMLKETEEPTPNVPAVIEPTANLPAPTESLSSDVDLSKLDSLADQFKLTRRDVLKQAAGSILPKPDLSPLMTGAPQLSAKVISPEPMKIPSTPRTVEVVLALSDIIKKAKQEDWFGYGEDSLDIDLDASDLDFENIGYDDLFTADATDEEAAGDALESIYDSMVALYDIPEEALEGIEPDRTNLEFIELDSSNPSHGGAHYQIGLDLSKMPPEKRQLLEEFFDAMEEGGSDNWEDFISAKRPEKFAKGGSIKKEPPSLLSLLKKSAESMANQVPFIDDEQRKYLGDTLAHAPAAFATQWMTTDPETGELVVPFNFAAQNQLRRGDMDALQETAQEYEDLPPIGLIDDTVSLPAAFSELGGYEAPQWSQEALDRVSLTEQNILDEMGLEAPRGIPQHFTSGLGLMAGQLPVPDSVFKRTATTLKEVPGALGKVARWGTALPRAGVEFFSPIVNPSMGSYLAGAAFGTGLGALGEAGEEEADMDEQAIDDLIARAEAGDAEALQLLEMLAQQMEREEYSKGGKVKNTGKTLDWVIDRIRSEIDPNITKEQIEVYADPFVDGVYAVRVKGYFQDAPDQPFDFLVHPDDPEFGPEVEEVEYGQWPPASGGRVLGDGDRVTEDEYDQLIEKDRSKHAKGGKIIDAANRFRAKNPKTDKSSPSDEVFEKLKARMTPQERQAFEAAMNPPLERGTPTLMAGTDTAPDAVEKAKRGLEGVLDQARAYNEKLVHPEQKDLVDRLVELADGLREKARRYATPEEARLSGHRERFADRADEAQRNSPELNQFRRKILDSVNRMAKETQKAHQQIIDTHSYLYKPGQRLRSSVSGRVYEVIRPTALKRDKVMVPAYEFKNLETGETERHFEIPDYYISLDGPKE